MSGAFMVCVVIFLAVLFGYLQIRENKRISVIQGIQKSRIENMPYRYVAFERKVYKITYDHDGIIWDIRLTN